MKKPNYEAVSYINKALSLLRDNIFEEARGHLSQALVSLDQSNNKRIKKNKYYEEFLKKGLTTNQRWLESIKPKPELEIPDDKPEAQE